MAGSGRAGCHRTLSSVAGSGWPGSKLWVINCVSVPASVVVKMPCAEFPIAIELFAEREGMEKVAGSDLRAIPSGWSFCDTHHDTVPGARVVAVGSSR